MRKTVITVLLMWGVAWAGAPAQKSGTQAINLGMVISGGVSLGAYEAGYNWALVRVLAAIRQKGILEASASLRAVAGASAGSINALLSAVYWCQDPEKGEDNSVEKNLFYETWVNLGLEDLLVPPDDTRNRSTLFSRRVLKKKARKIVRHLRRPLYREGCEVGLGFSVTKVEPIVVDTYQKIAIENQAFSIPLTLRSVDGRLRFESRRIRKLSDLYTLEIPGIEKHPEKISEILFASSAFPGAFTQVKLRYRFQGKEGEGYFIDGGVYNNTPLDLAIALDNRTSLFLFLDPNNMRKHRKVRTSPRMERPPVGFLSANLTPLANAAEIYQKIFLYQAINRYFRGERGRRLLLSSRFHPLTAGFLEHFGAFLDRNFRLYDYHVGVYDAIHQLSEALRKKKPFRGMKQTELMDRLARHLGIDRNREARTAYRFFKATEYGGKVARDNRYAAIYYAFRKGVGEEERYSAENFKYFLKHLDMRYLPVKPHSFLAYATRHPERWYKRPLRYVINRITALENYHAEVDPNYQPVADLLNVLAWSGYSLVRNKEGLEVQEINAPSQKRHAALRGALRLLPKEVAVDAVNGGMSFAYEASYYADMGWIDGLQFRGSYNFQPRDEGGDFLRLDADIMHAYNEAFTFGFGFSGFGNVERSFWDRQSAFGANAYVDFMEVLRATYVWRDGEGVNNHSLYLGIENLPSLIYWLNR